MKVIILAVVVMTMCGCTTKFCKQGATTSDFERDQYSCSLRARQMAQFGDVYNPFEELSQQRSCLLHKGWSNNCP